MSWWRNMTIFSVAPIEGFKSVRTKYDFRNMSQNEVARSYREPQRELVNVRFFAEADSFWGGEDAETYISEPITNPSWRKVMALFRKSIVTTNDHHHIFLEGVEFTGKFHEDGCEYVEFLAGS